MAVIRRKSSKYWYIVFYKNGKHHWLSTKTENKSEAIRMELELREVVDKKAEEKRMTSFIEKVSGQIVKHPGIPIDAAWDILMAQPGQNDKKERTLDSKHQIWNSFAHWIKSTYPELENLSDIDRNVAVNYAKYMQADGKSNQTYNNHRHNLRGIFKALLYSANMKENPFDVVPTLAARHISFRPFSKEELQAILKNSNSDWRTAVIIASYTGLRFKDVCFLKWSDVDFGKKLIELEPAKTERFARKVHIPIHQALNRELLKIKQDSEYVLPYMAKNYPRRGFQSEFAKILAAAAIGDSTEGKAGFHSLRHTFVTMLEESGAARHASQKLVGHGSPIMTELYSHDVKTAIDAVNKLPDLLS